MSDKVTLLMNSLNEFYKDGKYISKIKPILDQKAEVSLRILDWFITNYAKKYRVIINGNFDVYQNYKLMLRSFSKRQFDPFCRKNKIVFYYQNWEDSTDKNATKGVELKSSSQMTDEACLETSCGQLCFFRWCFQNGIIDYVENHLEEIENDMKQSLKTDRKETPQERKQNEKKRQQLSVSAARSVSKRNVKYTIKFD